MSRWRAVPKIKRGTDSSIFGESLRRLNTQPE
jgi:hypothetical protein